MEHHRSLSLSNMKRNSKNKLNIERLLKNDRWLHLVNGKKYLIIAVFWKGKALTSRSYSIQEAPSVTSSNWKNSS